MARPRKCRRICSEPLYDSFAPRGIRGQEEVVLSVDEYEVIRLIDLEKMTHEQCAKVMNISRTTVTEIYESSRGKIADSIVNGKFLKIAGGDYCLCDGSAYRYCHKVCKKWNGEAVCTAVSEKGERVMRIAVTYENGEVFQHFGHTEQFKLYDCEDGKVTKEQIVDTNGQGHGALSEFLRRADVDLLICGGIGGGARQALSESGIQLCGGVSGNADDVIQAYLAGNLVFDPDAQCGHHHGSGHSCGEDKHGCGGNGGQCGR